MAQRKVILLGFGTLCSHYFEHNCVANHWASCQHCGKIFVSLERKNLSEWWNSPRNSQMHIFQRFLAKSRESLGPVNAHIHTGQQFQHVQPPFRLLDIPVCAKPKYNFQVSNEIHSSYWKFLCLFIYYCACTPPSYSLHENLFESVE